MERVVGGLATRAGSGRTYHPKHAACESALAVFDLRLALQVLPSERAAPLRGLDLSLRQCPLSPLFPLAP